jgi:hypothetical protein
MMPLRQRRPRQEDRAFLAFVRTKPCCVCGAHPPVQAAHIRMASAEHGKSEGGIGRKPDDRFATPLCSICHLDGPDAQHKVGERKFWQRVGIDPFAVAMKLYAEFRPNGFPSDNVRKRPSQVKRTSDSRPKTRRPKRKWASRPLKSGSRWPKRKLNRSSK